MDIASMNALIREIREKTPQVFAHPDDVDDLRAAAPFGLNIVSSSLVDPGSVIVLNPKALD